MPSWKEHEKYCRDKNVDSDACKFANELIDNPEETLPAILQDERLRKHLYQIFGFEWIYWKLVEMKNYWKALSHGELHGTSKKIDVEDVKIFRKLIEEISAYYYGVSGMRAVQLHFELDEADHVLKEIRQAVLQSIKGACYIPSERRYLPTLDLVSKALSSMDANYVSRILVETGPHNDKLKNYRNFLVNIRRLIKQRSKAAAIPGKTFEQVINENPKLQWLNPLIEEANTSDMNSGWATYECPNCHRKVTKPEGAYYCKDCGANFTMVKINDIKIKDMSFED
jgi:hypothetical protein